MQVIDFNFACLCIANFQMLTREDPWPVEMETGIPLLKDELNQFVVVQNLSQHVQGVNCLINEDDNI